MSADQERQALIDRYAAGARLVRQAFDDLDTNDYDRAPAGEWTPRQILQHLADSELVGSVRLRLLLAQDAPILPLYDQERWAANLDYAAGDAKAVGAAVALFERLRAANVLLVRHAPDAAWERIAMHPERGRMTLFDLVELYTDHVDGHLSQAARYTQ